VGEAIAKSPTAQHGGPPCYPALGLGLLAISDQGQPSYNESLATTLAEMGMPCFGCTPEHLPELLAGVLRGTDLKVLASRVGTTNKKS
jgi:hypothetical protein